MCIFPPPLRNNVSSLISTTIALTSCATFLRCAISRAVFSRAAFNLVPPADPGPLVHAVALMSGFRCDRNDASLRPVVAVTGCIIIKQGYQLLRDFIMYTLANRYSQAETELLVVILPPLIPVSVRIIYVRIYSYRFGKTLILRCLLI